MNRELDHPTPKPLSDAFARLERRLAAPIVPGELRGWLQSVAASIGEVAPLLRDHIARNHAQQHETILQQDAELSHRVSQLKSQDSQLLSDLDAINSEALAMQTGCEQAATEDTQPLYDAADKLSARGLELVIAFRKQEAALATWFVEAFQRDRGNAD